MYLMQINMLSYSTIVKVLMKNRVFFCLGHSILLLNLRQL